MPPLTFEGQVGLLKDRGLLIDDDDAAIRLLSNVNYYHLEGYWYPFYNKEKETHVFYEDIHLDQIVRHYEFDRELKSIVFSGLSKIEVAFRTQFAYWIKGRCGQILGPQIERRRFSHPSTNPISPKSMYSEYSSISFFISGTT